MKLKIADVLCVLLCVFILVGGVYLNRYKIKNRIHIWIDNSLENERVRNGFVEFSIATLGNYKFEVNRYKDGKKFEYVEDGERITLLEDVVYYSGTPEGIICIIAEDGCAIIGIDNIAKIYGSDCKRSFAEVVYLTDFKEFTADEQKMLKRFMQY